MATYYVDGTGGSNGNPGTTGSPWATLQYAYGQAAAGDTVKVRTATYYEWLNIAKTGMIFEADTGHTPTIDGRYSPALFGAAGYKTSNGGTPSANELPCMSAANAALGNWVFPGANISTKGYSVIVRLTAANSKIKGFIIRNVAGRALGLEGNNAIAEDCVIDFTYGGAVFVAAANTGGKLHGCTVTRSSVKTFDPGAPGAGPDAVQTTVIVAGKDNIIEENIVAFCYGEGISADKGSARPIIRNNVIHTNGHWGLGFNYTSGAQIYGNVCYWCDNLLAAMGKNTPGDLFVGGSERASPTAPAEAYSPDIMIYNNLMVGGKRGFVLGGDGRPVQFVRSYIGYNTVVGYDVAIDPGKGDRPVWTWSTMDVAPHKDTLVENNIIIALGARSLTSFKDKGTTTWRHNLSNDTFPKGTNNITTSKNATTLVDSDAVITGTYNVKSTALPDVTTTFNAANYDLASSSGAIGRASDRSNITGLTNPQYNKDRYGAGRTDFNAGAGRYYDIGADEYDASGPPVDPDTITASFNRTPAGGAAPLTVNFTDTSVVTGSAAITDWLWNFGDGTTSTSQNPTKVYSAAGTYTTTLTITDSVNSLTSTFTGGTVTVTAVVAGSVSARFTRSPAAGEAGVTLFTFADTSTETGDGNIDTWEWDFRDGTTSALQNPTHTYAAAGTYRPRLTVRDSVGGYSSTWTGPDTVVGDAPADPLIEAAFDQDVTTGQAPLTVTFTDTSQEVGGANIDGWAWEFGDGNTSTTASPVHVYQAAGTYTPRLTVTDSGNGLVDVFTGSPIVVTAAPPPGAGGDVVIRQTRVALNTSSGNQTITAAGLGGITPKSARLIVVGATADGSAANNEMLGYGATAGGAQWAAAMAAEHGAADTNAARMWTDDACLLLVNGGGDEVLRATFVAWTADGLTINLDWTGTPTAYLVTVVFGAGTEYEAWAGTAALGATNATTNVSVGFAADAVHTVATWGGRETAETDATLSLGLAHRLGGQYVVERYYPDGLADAANRLRVFEDSVMHCRYNTAARADGRITEWSSVGFTIKVLNDNINSTGLILAEKFGDVGSRVALVDSAIVTGNTNYALDWDPQFVEHLISQSTILGSYNDNQKAGTIGVHTVTDDGEFSNEVSGENGSATTNEQSLTDNQFIVVGHTGTTVAAGATTLGTAQYTINYATAPAGALKLPSLAVEEGAATGGGGDYVTAEFEADVVSGAVPLFVQFSDLSAGTNPLIGWLWDFGDGATSFEQNPTHTYHQGRDFTVSLTVTDGPIDDTEEKSGYIVAVAAVKREIIFGPYVLRAINEASTPVTHRDPNDEENGGYMEGGLALNHLRLNADPEPPGAVSGEVSLYVDAETGDLKVMYSDGTIGTVTVT
jgi:PKD repeat protein